MELNWSPSRPYRHLKLTSKNLEFLKKIKFDMLVVANWKGIIEAKYEGNKLLAAYAKAVNNSITPEVLTEVPFFTVDKNNGIWLKRGLSNSEKQAKGQSQGSNSG